MICLELRYLSEQLSKMIVQEVIIRNPSQEFYFSLCYHDSGVK